jgi:hypothetical protein
VRAPLRAKDTRSHAGGWGSCWGGESGKRSGGHRSSADLSAGRRAVGGRSTSDGRPATDAADATKTGERAEDHHVAPQPVTQSLSILLARRRGVKRLVFFFGLLPTQAEEKPPALPAPLHRPFIPAPETRCGRPSSVHRPLDTCAAAGGSRLRPAVSDKSAVTHKFLERRSLGRIGGARARRGGIGPPLAVEGGVSGCQHGERSLGSRWPWERWYTESPRPSAVAAPAQTKAVRFALAMGEVVQRAGAAFFLRAFLRLRQGEGFC